MEETYTSFETAKLAREKNFLYENGKTAWTEDGKNKISPPSSFFNEDKYPIINSTQSLLAKWLREVHNIHIEISFGKDKNSIWFDYNIYGLNLVEENTGQDAYEESYKPICSNEDGGYNTYEQALEEGLLNALKLIK